MLLHFAKNLKKLAIGSTIPLILLENELPGMPFAELPVEAAKDI
jgi:hypothetical protein